MKENTIVSEKIIVSLVANGEGWAYDVALTDKTATVADYIDALDAFLAAKVASCLGCVLCCRQRIPLTLPDLYCWGEEAEWPDFLRHYGVIEKRGPALDIRLQQDADENCVFLDEEQGRCRQWPRRSLVCHTYICLPQTARSRELRECLINEGEDALASYVIAHGLAPAGAHYPPKPAWEGRRFDEIPLIEVLPSELFAAIYQGIE